MRQGTYKANSLPVSVFLGDFVSDHSCHAQPNARTARKLL